MPVSLRAIHSLIELWDRREEPDGPDVPRALHLARTLEPDPEAPAYLRGFAWHLVEEIHRSAGWQIPDTEQLSFCHGAAASISHSSALILADIATEIKGLDTPVLVLGALAASRSLFGRWDLLAARGALLIPLSHGQGGITRVDILASQQGIRWGHPGSLLEVLRMHSREVELNGHTVRVPTAALIAARAAETPGPPAELSSFLLCASAHHAATRGTWEAAHVVAKTLGRQSALRQSAVRCSLDEWLGVQIPRRTRLAVRLRELLSPGLHGSFL